MSADPNQSPNMYISQFFFLYVFFFLVLSASMDSRRPATGGAPARTQIRGRGHSSRAHLMGGRGRGEASPRRGGGAPARARGGAASSHARPWRRLRRYCAQPRAAEKLPCGSGGAEWRGGGADAGATWPDFGKSSAHSMAGCDLDRPGGLGEQPRGGGRPDVPAADLTPLARRKSRLATMRRRCQTGKKGKRTN